MLPLNNELEQIREFARRFFRLAAQDRLNEACALLDEPTSRGHIWTRESILRVVHETFHPGTIFFQRHPDGPRFTNPNELAEPVRFEVYMLKGGSGYWYDYDVPLNGEWSDLTAQFEFKRQPGGLAAILNDLHVL